MKKLLLLFVSLALLTHSCITIEERYSFNRDGSGSMEYLLDLSEIAGLMQMADDSTMEGDMEMMESFFEAQRQLVQVEGIHDPEITGTKEDYIFGLRFDFDDIPSLNEALNIILEEGKDFHTYVEKKGRRKFYRIHRPSEDLTREELLGDEMDEEYADEILESMKYKLSFAFERDVKKVETTGNVVESGNPSEVLIDNNFKAITDNPSVMDVFIKTR